MSKVTSKQWFQIISGTVSGLITGAAFFQTLFGQSVTLDIVAGLGLANILVSSIGTVISGPDSQDAQIRNVLAMPGVQKIDVNAQASPALAKLAVDPTVDKIAPTPAAETVVSATAKAAS